MLINFPIGCALCGLDSSFFTALSLILGTWLVVFTVLPPIHPSVRRWGFPKINVTRLGAIVVDFIWLVPISIIGIREHALMQVIACIGGLLLCVIYLWYRLCWLLDELRIVSHPRQFLYLGVFWPMLFVFGTAVGKLLLSVLLLGLTWPEMLAPVAMMHVIVAVPLGLILYWVMSFVLPGGYKSTIPNDPLGSVVVMETASTEKLA